jgi:hypothetical protein
MGRSTLGGLARVEEAVQNDHQRQLVTTGKDDLLGQVVHDVYQS